jgi:outer membrane protein
MSFNLNPNKAFAGLFAALLIAVAAGSAEAQNAPRIGWVDLNRIVDQAPGWREARQELEALATRSRQELQRMEEELEELVQQYERQRGTMSQARREEREQDLMQRQQALFQRGQQLEQEIGERQAELMGPLFNRIEAVVNDIRSEGNYALIFDVQAGGVMAADPNMDISDQVLTRLRETANNR